MKIDIKNVSGAKVGDADLDDSVWGADVNEHLLWEVVNWQRAKARAGTHSTLTVAEVRGTGKKPYRQKGTGNARQGTLKGHHHVGGGRAFGPKPRDYDYALPKKVKKAGLRSALSLRAKEAKLIVLDAFDLTKVEAAAAHGDKGKAKKDAKRFTARVAAALGKLGVKKALIVDDVKNVDLARGAKNLAHAKWIAPAGLNVYDVLKYETLVITSASAKTVEEFLHQEAK